MAQMERNVNLEEIDSDALFGIDALKGQSIYLPWGRDSSKCVYADVSWNAKSGMHLYILRADHDRYCLWM